MDMSSLSTPQTPLMHILSYTASQNQLQPVEDIFPVYNDRQRYPCQPNNTSQGLRSPLPANAITLNDIKMQKLLIKFTMQDGQVVNPYLGKKLASLLTWDAVLTHCNFILAFPADDFLKNVNPQPILDQTTFEFFEKLAEKSEEDRRKELCKWHNNLLSKHKSYIMAFTYADMYYTHSYNT